MDYTVYFADKAVTFVTLKPLCPCFEVRLDAGERIGRAKVLKILETHNFIAVVSSEIELVFEAFALEFTPIAAAGGIVVNDRGEWLMIHRNDRWDLPKGHLEEFESLEQCAVREVGEETGVEGSTVVGKLCDTLHCYNLYGKWELKCTHWFALRVRGEAPTSPQTEEGIDRVVWCSPERVAENMKHTFPTIRYVAECMRLIVI